MSEQTASAAAQGLIHASVLVALGRQFGLQEGPFMNTWWLMLTSLSRSDSATTGCGNSEYQPWGARLDVITIERLAAMRREITL